MLGGWAHSLRLWRDKWGDLSWADPGHPDSWHRLMHGIGRAHVRGIDIAHCRGISHTRGIAYSRRIPHTRRTSHLVTSTEMRRNGLSRIHHSLLLLLLHHWVHMLAVHLLLLHASKTLAGAWIINTVGSGAARSINTIELAIATKLLLLLLLLLHELMLLAGIDTVAVIAHLVHTLGAESWSWTVHSARAVVAIGPHVTHSPHLIETGHWWVEIARASGSRYGTIRSVSHRTVGIAHPVSALRVEVGARASKARVSELLLILLPLGHLLVVLRHHGRTVSHLIETVQRLIL